MKKSEWLDCQRNEFFPKQKGIPSLVKIEHKNTATLDSARSKKKSKVAVLQLCSSMAHVSSDVYRRGEFSYVYVSPVQVVAATSIDLSILSGAL